MCPWTWSALVQAMACCLFGAKPLPEPMLAFDQLESWEQISVKFEFEFYHFHSRKCIWKCCLRMAAILSRGDELGHHHGSCVRVPPPAAPVIEKIFSLFSPAKPQISLWLTLAMEICVLGKQNVNKKCFACTRFVTIALIISGEAFPVVKNLFFNDILWDTLH